MNRRQMVVVLHLVSATLFLLNGIWLWRTVVGPERESISASRAERASVNPIVQPAIEPLDVSPWLNVYFFSERPVQPVAEVKPEVRVAEKRVSPPGFRVVTMVVSSVANESLVVVAGGSEERGQILRIGQERDGYRLVEVTSESAVFENSGQLVPLQPSASK